MSVTLAQQISAVKREIALRHSVYPKLVAAHKKRQAEADRDTADMEAVLATLTALSVLDDSELADLRAVIRERRAA